MSELEDPDVPSVEELLSALLIQEIRNYDVMIHLLAHFDEEGAKKILDLHEGLNLYGPLPFPVEE